MKTNAVTIDGHQGSIFEGELPETYCFVPEECISTDRAGLHVNELDYVRSGWDVRNMRFSETTDGQHLFPKPLCPVINLEDEAVRKFLTRIKSVQCA